MRIFDHPNMTGGFTCPICKTGEDKPVTLVGIHGTEEGHIMEASQVHVDCIELCLYTLGDEKLIAMRFE